MKQITIFMKQQHPFHSVTLSPWPILTSFSVLSFVLSTILYLHFPNEKGLIKMIIAFILIIFCIFRWFSDIITESTFEGNHTIAVQKGLRQGMLLFIVSEIMFFFGFLWAFFHSALIPSIFIGAIWPPLGIEILNPWGLPFMNTLILLSSGVSITWAHRAILAGFYTDVLFGLEITITLGILFTILQIHEYIMAPFATNSGIYGSIFSLATGFHGFHVIVGTIFLCVCLIRQYKFHLMTDHHFGFEAAAWYWHFADVVWLFSFTTIYWRGS